MRKASSASGCPDCWISTYILTNFLAPQDPLPKYSHLRTGITAPASLTGFVKLKEFEKFYCWVDDKHYVSSPIILRVYVLGGQTVADI